MGWKTSQGGELGRGHHVAVMLALQQVLACCCFQLFVLFNKIDLIYIEKVLNRNVTFLFLF